MIKLSPAWQERGGVTWGWPRATRRRWCRSWGWRSTRCSLSTSSRVWSGTRRTGRNSWWPGPRGCRYPNPDHPGKGDGLLVHQSPPGEENTLFQWTKIILFFCYFLSSSGPVYYSPFKFNLFIPTLQGVPKKGSTAFQEISFPKSIKTPNFFERMADKNEVKYGYPPK